MILQKPTKKARWAVLLFALLLAASAIAIAIVRGSEKTTASPHPAAGKGREVLLSSSNLQKLSASEDPRTLNIHVVSTVERT